MVTHVVKFDVPEAARPRKCWVWIQNRYLLRRSYMWIIYRRNLLFHSMKDVMDLNDKVGGAAGFASFKVTFRLKYLKLTSEYYDLLFVSYFKLKIQ